METGKPIIWRNRLEGASEALWAHVARYLALYALAALALCLVARESRMERLENDVARLMAARTESR